MAEGVQRGNWRKSPLVWRLYQGLLVTVAGATLAVEGLAHAAHQHGASAPAAACTTTGQVIQLEFAAGRFSPTQLRARRCDRLVLVNHDTTSVELAFGPHEHHVPYPGLDERVLDPGDQLTLVLAQTGQYELHDHIADLAESELTVAP